MSEFDPFEECLEDLRRQIATAELNNFIKRNLDNVHAMMKQARHHALGKGFVTETGEGIVYCFFAVDQSALKLAKLVGDNAELFGEGTTVRTTELGLELRDLMENKGKKGGSDDPTNT
jgi:hypothetical protein